jgi:hypothetical protein
MRYLAKVALLSSTAGLVLGGCQSNSLNGVPRLIGASSAGNGVYGTGGKIATCPAESTGLNLVEDFIKYACASHAQPGDARMASLMIDAGVTLNRARCADFFRQRGSGQMTGRIIRRSIAPLSALITGVLGIINFESDADRAEAQQILALSSSALEGGLSVYEAEFLFDADNIRAVEALTMRDLDEHGTAIINQPGGFYQGLRHLLDHQSKCRPTHILQLAQAAIKQGRVEPINKPAAVAAVGVANSDQAAMSQLAEILGVANLTNDQAGWLWWLIRGDQIDKLPKTLVASRLGPDLTGMFLDPAAAAPTLRSSATPIVNGIKPVFDSLSVQTIALFNARQARISVKAAEVVTAGGNVVDSVKAMQFSVAGGTGQRSTGSVETDVVARGDGGT